MPASTVAEIFQFEDALVAAVVAAFNADSVLGAASTYGPRQLAELPKARIDCIALGFAKASEQQVYAQERWWDQHFAGDLTLTIITPRSSAAAASHATRVGRVRYLLSPKAALFTGVNLPHYEILSVENTGATYDFDESTDTDRSELTFRVDLGILASAFPSEVPEPEPDPEPEPEGPLP